MTERELELLASMKLAERLINDHPNVFGSIRLAPPVQDMRFLVQVIELCAGNKSDGARRALPVLLREERYVRRHVEYLAQPLLRWSAELAAAWGPGKPKKRSARGPAPPTTGSSAPTAA